MNSVSVHHLDGDRFATTSVPTPDRDQPVQDGGTDSAPSPTELFVASLASCVAHYARRYLARHCLPRQDPEGTASYTTGTAPARVTNVQVELRVSGAVPPERRDALLTVASHCTVHNSLTQPPSIEVPLEPVAAQLG